MTKHEYIYNHKNKRHLSQNSMLLLAFFLERGLSMVQSCVYSIVSIWGILVRKQVWYFGAKNLFQELTHSSLCLLCARPQAQQGSSGLLGLHLKLPLSGECASQKQTRHFLQSFTKMDPLGQRLLNLQNTSCLPDLRPQQTSQVCRGFGMEKNGLCFED